MIYSRKAHPIVIVMDNDDDDDPPFISYEAVLEWEEREPLLIWPWENLYLGSY